MSKLRSFAFVASCLLSTVASATQTIILPPITLGSTETAEVDLRSIAADYPGWGFGGPCQVTVTFYGPSGTALASPSTLSVGDTAQIVSATLLFSATGARTTNVPVSVQLLLTPASYTYEGPAPPVPDCAVAFSLQIYDSATGNGHMMLGGEAAQGTTEFFIIGSAPTLPCLSPGDECMQLYTHEPSGTQILVTPPLGLAASEQVEVDLSSAIPAPASSAVPCNGSVTFYGANGSVLATSASFSIGSSQQVFSAAFPYSALAAGGQRGVVSAQIALTSAASAAGQCQVVYSIKTNDTSTGITHIYISGQTTAQEMSPLMLRLSPPHHIIGRP